MFMNTWSCLLYTSLLNTAWDTEGFYKSFFYLEMLLLLFMPALNFMYYFIFRTEYLTVFIILTGVNILRITFTISITSEFCNINRLIKDLYYGINIDVNERTVKRWLRQSRRRKITFECGYFDMDVSIFMMMLNYFSLFVFALIKEPTQLDSL